MTETKLKRENVSRDGKRFVDTILELYVKDMINDNDYRRLRAELLDVIAAERGVARRRTR